MYIKEVFKSFNALKEIKKLNYLDSIQNMNLNSSMRRWRILIIVDLRKWENCSFFLSKKVLTTGSK